MRSIVIFRFFSHLSLLFVYQCITFLPLIFRFSFYINTEGNQFTDNYIIVDKTISVSGVKMIDGSPTDPFVHTVYTLSGNMIAAKEEKSENKYMSNAVYTAVENRYTYSSNWLKSVSQIIQWPNEDGSGYQVRELGEVDRYSWENGNAVHYAYLPQKEITYEYNSQLRPENFPFRVVNSFQPVGFDVISPLNLLYGKMNQNLPTRAYWYNVSDATDICAEYTFRYTLTGDYITGMTIEEKINPVNGATAENNTYEYEFIYNFVVEQK